MQLIFVAPTTVDPQLFGPYLSSTSIIQHGILIHYECALIRNCVKFASSAIENVLLFTYPDSGVDAGVRIAEGPL